MDHHENIRAWVKGIEKILKPFDILATLMEGPIFHELKKTPQIKMALSSRPDNSPVAAGLEIDGNTYLMLVSPKGETVLILFQGSEPHLLQELVNTFIKGLCAGHAKMTGMPAIPLHQPN